MLCNKWAERALVSIALCLFFSIESSAQLIYFNDDVGNIHTLNLADCSTTFVTSGPVYNDMAVGANGLLYGLFGLDIYEINPVTGTNTLIGTIPPPTFVVTGLEISSSGIIYILGTGLWSLNTANGALNFNGEFPNDWSGIGDITFFNGQYYASVVDPTTSEAYLIQVNTGNPANSVIVGNLPAYFLVAGASVNSPNCPKQFWFETFDLTQPSTLWEYDVNTQTWATKCPGFPFTVGGAGSPADYSFPIACACPTFAGTVTAELLSLCVPEPVLVPFNNNEYLENDDALEYILFSDPADTIGSILVRSANPSIVFNPAILQTGTVYYLATLAGNELPNGQVDLNDPCLDVSTTAAQVVWHPKPSMSFSVSDPDICEGGCRSIQVSFVGSPPFTFIADTISGGNTIGIFVETISGISGSFLLCAPPGTPPGGLTIQATSLIDAFCTCE